MGVVIAEPATVSERGAYGLGCLPRWATPRNPTRRTLGPRVAEIAEMLGTPLMPWQRYVADVALEIDPATGKLAYSEVVLTVPRQSGKTTLLLSIMVHRALGFESAQRIVYTAQTRNDARKKWEDEHVRVLQQSPLRSMHKVRLQYGAEAIRWQNGSMHTVTAPTERAIHGEVLDLGVVDEAFAQVDNRLEQGMGPAMITRPQPQLWVVSTAGTPTSVYLREKVEAGRLRVNAGVDSSVAYFEWSAPGDADPSDPKTWWNCMPALGHTVTERAVRTHHETMKLTEFRRAYLNQWPDESPDEWLVIPQAAWTALEDPNSQALDPIAIAADVSPDRSHGAIAVAGKRKDNRLHVEVVAHKAKTSWMVGALVELHQNFKPCAVVIDGKSQASSLIPALEVAGIEVIKLNHIDAKQAVGMFYESVVDSRTLRHLGQPKLAAALGGAQKRFLGDAWLWDRKGLSVDLSPLVAATNALWGYVTKSHSTDQFFAFAWK